jgi:hypothetical protein
VVVYGPIADDRRRSPVTNQNYTMTCVREGESHNRKPHPGQLNSAAFTGSGRGVHDGAFQALEALDRPHRLRTHPLRHHGEDWFQGRRGLALLGYPEGSNDGSSLAG